MSNVLAQHPVSASDDLIREHAYIVARGVRPLALVDEFPADSLVMLRVATSLEAIVEDCIPFVIDHGDGSASCGFAGAPWVIDLYRWVRLSTDVPQCHRDQIVGLLLGYSTEAIARFDGNRSGRLFQMPTPT